MKKFLQRNRDILVFWGTLLALALLIANVWKDGLVTAAYLAAHKDAIQAAGSIASAVVLIVGALFTYYRFFKGRTFSSRGQVTIHIKVHEFSPTENLHVVKIVFRNIGTTAIYNPKLKLLIDSLPDATGREVVADWINRAEQPGDAPKMAFVDPDETVAFLVHRTIAKTTKIVVYTAIVTSEDQITWQDAESVTNQASGTVNAGEASAS